MKSICAFIWKLVIVWPLKVVFFPFFIISKLFRKRRKQETFTVPYEPVEEQPEDEKELEPQEPICRIGSIVPVEEDNRLRTFKIIDNEGEIYKINTSLEGKFYGSIWTRILACYESRQTLRGRITKQVYDATDKPIGFQVKVGNITTFLPLAESLRTPDQNAINTLITITHIDPVKQKVTVSSKAAYESVFANCPIIVLNEKTKGLCWSYDDNYIYMLLPHKYMATASYDFTSITQVEEWMGKIIDVQVESIKRKEKEALVSIIETDKIPELLENVS